MSKIMVKYKQAHSYIVNYAFMFTSTICMYLYSNVELEYTNEKPIQPCIYSIPPADLSQVAELPL